MSPSTIHPMQPYHDLLAELLHSGEVRNDRTQVGTRAVFGRQLRYELGAGFPLLTSKKLHVRSIVYELLWFLRGDTNVGYLRENGVTIWDEWADAEGNLGPIYGKQWRSWPRRDGSSIDQLALVLESLRNDPHSRRHVVSAWNVADLEAMALPPCHLLFQFFVHEPLASGEPPRLSCQLYQRSADLFLGVPFNIASYALLTHMMAHVLGYGVGEFIHTLGDVHLYANHFEVAQELLRRDLKPLPTLRLNPAVKRLEDFEFSDIIFENYEPHPALKAAVAV